MSFFPVHQKGAWPKKLEETLVELTSPTFTIDFLPDPSLLCRKGGNKPSSVYLRVRG